MPKALLFLYPCSHYIDPLEENAKESFAFFNLSDDEVEMCMNGINEEIQKYRNDNFTIYFAAFSKGYKIEEELISSRIDIYPNDKLIPAGISWAPNDKFQHPDPSFILGQLKQPIEELVIGGFHESDCCAKLLSAATAQDFNARIEKNVTDSFYAWGIKKYYERVGGITLEEAGIVYGYEFM